MSRPDALNLEAISKAIDQHDLRCPFPVTAILMSPFECERLGWDAVRGYPVVSDENMGTGRFRLECDRPTDHDEGAASEIKKELLTT